jgi:hypothetical protein
VCESTFAKGCHALVEVWLPHRPETNQSIQVTGDELGRANAILSVLREEYKFPAIPRLRGGASMASEGKSEVSSEELKISTDQNASEEFFLVRLGDLPESLTKELRVAVTCFVVPILLDEEFYGSGVLIQVDGHYGILTAEHVVNPPQRKSIQDGNTDPTSR